MADKTKSRYIKISSPALGFCICKPCEAPTLIREFIGSDEEPMREKVTVEEVHLTDEELDLLPEWEG